MDIISNYELERNLITDIIINHFWEDEFNFKRFFDFLINIIDLSNNEIYRDYKNNKNILMSEIKELINIILGYEELCNKLLWNFILIHN